MAEIFVCLIIIAVSIFFFVQTLSFPTVTGFEKMGAEFWPRLNLIGMAILALVIMVPLILALKKSPSQEVEDEKPKNTKGVVVCGAIVLGFIILMSYIGFLLSAFLTMMALIYFLGERNKLLVFFSALTLVVSIYIAFGVIMFVPMPRGVWIFKELSYLLY